MAYKITFWHRKCAVYEKSWPREYEAATAYAKAQLSTQQRQYGATSVSVSCERTKKVLFSLTEGSELTDV